MKNADAVIRGALASLIAVGLTTIVAPAQAADTEKCAGVIKAGKNDCGTSHSGCHGSVKTDVAQHAQELVVGAQVQVQLCPHRIVFGVLLAHGFSEGREFGWQARGPGRARPPPPGGRGAAQDGNYAAFADESNS